MSLDELRQYVKSADVQCADVSAWSIGMHIHHTALAIIGVCNALSNSEPPTPSRSFSPLRFLLFRLGRFPRGRAKAPEVTLPRRDLSTDELDSCINDAANRLEDASRLPSDRWFKHFVFGVLNRDETLRFIDIHTRHHLRIIRDILVAATPGSSER